MIRTLAQLAEFAEAHPKFFAAPPPPSFPASVEPNQCRACRGINRVGNLIVDCPCNEFER